MLNTSNVTYGDWVVKRLNIDMDLDDGKLTTNHFEAITDFARLQGKIDAKMTTAMLKTPTKIPFNAKINIDGIELSDIPLEQLESLGIEGRSKAVITATGPVDNLKADFIYDMYDFEAMDIPIARTHLHATYADNTAGIPFLGVWLDPLQPGEHRAPDFGVNELTFDLKTNELALNTVLQPISPNKFLESGLKSPEAR